MSDETTHNKRIAKNTFLLYFRMLFILGASLYTSRLVLNTLGVDDYGIYNVVGGAVSILSLFSTSLANSAIRFLTVELGVGDLKAVNKVFCTAQVIHLILACIMLIFAEIIGVWFVNTTLNIPEARLNAANWVYQFSVASFFVSIVILPFDALIIAHERMKAFAYIGVFDIGLKFALIWGLANNTLDIDKLICYGGILLFVTIVTQVSYVIYCYRNFPESHYRFIWDRKILREMSGFAGWNFIGTSAGLLRDQGVNILLNLFYGPVVNAARGICYSVNNAVNSFVGNFMVALNPQITKSYSADNYTHAQSLVLFGCRFSYYILLLLIIPILFETEFVLKIWLTNYPAYTVEFIRLVLIFSITESLSHPLNTLQSATGIIRNYQVVTGIVILFNFPLSYIFLSFGFEPYFTIGISIFLSIICLLIRLFFLKKSTGLMPLQYLKEVVVNVCCVSLLSSIVPAIIYSTVSPGWNRFIVLSLSSVLWSLVMIYTMGCNGNERLFIRNLIIKKIYRKNQQY